MKGINVLNLKSGMLIFVMLFVFCLIGSTAIAQQNDFTGNLNFLVGLKKLEKDDWAPLEEQTEYGLELDFKQEDWPISIAFGIFTSDDEKSGYETEFGEIDVDGETTEIQIGIKKIVDEPSANLHFFFGGGLAHIKAEITGSMYDMSGSESDTGLGFWISGGTYWTFNKVFNLGLSLKYSKAEVTLFDVDGEAGGFHYGVLAGFAF